ncbi:MAG: hypothetical protein COX62_04535 [Deltaproteobacteria bacterium CG_4_10_14_0_2_um_filter_43_8]|nr:MAG: hypothetical protein COV43_04600 [Deltaproteobacteria bacterium CG11_big_fil_rev_8_21_14_0_20_42_23]PJA20512.1 MAG: hypothetical protein COX62_04535 [Deltaproteobacteria bacterium CG_4_10_14_0_2_um_filter_43_8]PJC65055.1 MAG: hypothetical protein CO021_00990 [Deltaproteobacteria bacterium CG_4_9_14_0_2_um_filter_42_21]
MADNLGEIVRKFREEKGLSQEALARLANCSTSFIGKLERWEEGGRNPSLDTIEAIGNALKIPIYKIITDLGELSQERPPNAVDAPSYIPHDIPVVGLAKAGRGGFFGDDGLPVDDWSKKIHRPSDVKDPHAYAVVIEGNSMEPVLKKGHKVLVITDREAQAGDWVVVQLKSGEVMVKEVSMKDGLVLLKSLNPLHEPIVLKKSEVLAIHPVVWIKRK